jgi:hypothetical protein
MCVVLTPAPREDIQEGDTDVQIGIAAFQQNKEDVFWVDVLIYRQIIPKEFIVINTILESSIRANINMQTFRNTCMPQFTDSHQVATFRDIHSGKVMRIGNSTGTVVRF